MSRALDRLNNLAREWDDIAQPAATPPASSRITLQETRSEADPREESMMRWLAEFASLTPEEAAERALNDPDFAEQAYQMDALIRAYKRGPNITGETNND
jgi:hypothetical protein